MSQFLIEALRARAKYLRIPGGVHQAWESFLASEFDALATAIEQLEEADADEADSHYALCRRD